MCCLLLSGLALLPSGSSSGSPASAPLSSVAPRLGPVAPASCGVFAPPAVGGSPAVLSRSSRSPPVFVPSRCRVSACVGSLAVRASSRSCCLLPRSGRRSCRRCSCPGRCRRLRSSVRSCLRLFRFARGFFFSRFFIYGCRCPAQGACRLRRGDGRQLTNNFDVTKCTNSSQNLYAPPAPYARTAALTKS